MGIRRKIKQVIRLSYYVLKIKSSDNFRLTFNYLRFKLLKLYIRNFPIDKNMLREILDLFLDDDKNRWDMYRKIKNIKRIVFELYRIQRRRILPYLK